MDIETPSQEIVVVGTFPPAPLVLVDNAFVQRLGQTEDIAKELIVRDETTQARAAALLNELTKAGTQVDNARAKLNEPFLDFQRKINATARVVQARIDNLKAILGGKLNAFRAEEERRAAEIELARQAEMRRLEAQQFREEQARRRAAEAEAARIRAAQPKIVEMEFDAPSALTATEERINAVLAAPVPVATLKPAGVRWSVSLRFEVMDVGKLPPEYVIWTPNMQKIRGLCAGWREGAAMPMVAGIRFYEDRQVVGTGR